MKGIKTSFISIFCLFLLFILSTGVYSQTAGILNFSCKTYAPTGNWGNKHVLAVWIENDQNPSKFIKTRSKYGHEDDHLTSWVAKSGKNLVDAVTGATLSSYDNQTVIWDGTDVNSNVVEDGTYNVFIEMGWGSDKVNQHSVMSFSFTKSAEAVQLSPAGNSNYSDVSVSWTPQVTFVNSINENKPVSVFPNPSSGKITLDFKSPVHSAIVSVQNENGSSLYSKKMENDFTGVLTIDLNSFANGVYFVRISAPDKQYNYKVLLNK